MLQSQMPLVICFLWSGVSARLYLGPPGAAAVICAAMPVVMTPSLPYFAPIVARRQLGFEHSQATRLASSSFVFWIKLSLLDITKLLPPKLKILVNFITHENKHYEILPAVH